MFEHLLGCCLKALLFAQVWESEVSQPLVRWIGSVCTAVGGCCVWFFQRKVAPLDPGGLWCCYYVRMTQWISPSIIFIIVISFYLLRLFFFWNSSCIDDLGPIFFDIQKWNVPIHLDTKCTFLYCSCLWMGWCNSTDFNLKTAATCHLRLSYPGGCGLALLLPGQCNTGLVKRTWTHRDL